MLLLLTAGILLPWVLASFFSHPVMFADLKKKKSKLAAQVQYA